MISLFFSNNTTTKTLAEVVEDENFISKPGEYSKHIEVKQDMAIKIYGHNQDSETVLIFAVLQRTLQRDIFLKKMKTALLSS